MPSPSRHPGTVPLACAMRSTPGLAHGGTTARLPSGTCSAAVLARGWMAAAAAGAAGRRPAPRRGMLPRSRLCLITQWKRSHLLRLNKNPTRRPMTQVLPDRSRPSRPLAGSAHPRPLRHPDRLLPRDITRGAAEARRNLGSRGNPSSTADHRAPSSRTKTDPVRSAKNWLW